MDYQVTSCIIIVHAKNLHFFISMLPEPLELASDVVQDTNASSNQLGYTFFWFRPKKPKKKSWIFLSNSLIQTQDRVSFAQVHVVVVKLTIVTRYAYDNFLLYVHTTSLAVIAAPRPCIKL